MTCGVCGDETHFRDHCPRNPQGGGQRPPCSGFTAESSTRQQEHDLGPLGDILAETTHPTFNLFTQRPDQPEGEQFDSPISTPARYTPAFHVHPPVLPTENLSRVPESFDRSQFQDHVAQLRPEADIIPLEQTNLVGIQLAQRSELVERLMAAVQPTPQTPPPPTPVDVL